MSEAKPTGIYAFKWLDRNGVTTGGNRPYKWELPIGCNPSKWHSNRTKKPIKVCVNGFHCIGAEEIVNFKPYGPRLFLVEIAGRFDSSTQKLAVEHIRLIEELTYMYKNGGLIVKSQAGLPSTYLKESITNSGRIGLNAIGKV